MPRPNWLPEWLRMYATPKNQRKLRQGIVKVLVPIIALGLLFGILFYLWRNFTQPSIYPIDPLLLLFFNAFLPIYVAAADLKESEGGSFAFFFSVVAVIVGVLSSVWLLLLSQGLLSTNPPLYEAITRIVAELIGAIAGGLIITAAK